MSQNILVRVEELTSWCSNSIIVETATKFCAWNQVEKNKGIQRPMFQMLTLAWVFSIVDAKEGFLQCPLDEPLSYLTTMHTLYGRYWWFQMLFGINSALEELPIRVTTALEGLEGIASIADDVLIYGEGETDEEADVNHDIHLVQLMERCKERWLKLNPIKFKFKLPQLKFTGHWMTKAGVAIDP